jgi:TP901 family phage tail tape measure protein
MAAVRHMDLIITSNATAAIRGFSDLGAIAKRTEARFGKLAGTLVRVGTVAAAGAIAFGGASVKAFIDFDDQMTKSLAIMGEVSGPMRKRMEKAAMSIAERTQFSATQVAEAYRTLGSAGYSAAESVEAIGVVATFAQAAQMDLAAASDYLTGAQEALGLRMEDPIKNMEQMKRITDVLTQANVLAQGEIEDFAAALSNKAASAMRTNNIEVEEGVAVLAAFAEQGVKGRTAGEKLAILLRDLPRAAKRNTDEFKKFGIEVLDGNDNLKNMADVVAEFEEALGPMSDGEKAAAFEALGLTRSVGDVLRQLMGTSPEIRRFEGELRNAGGTTQDVADKSMESLKAKLDVMKNKWHNLMIKVGEPIAIWLVDHFMPWVEDVFIPGLQDIGKELEKLKPLFEAIGDALNNPTVLKTLAGIVGFAGGFKVLGSILGFLAPVFGTLGRVFAYLLHPLKSLSLAWTAFRLALLAIWQSSVVQAIVTGLGAIAAALGVSIGVLLLIIAAVVAVGIAIWYFRDEIMRALNAAWRFIKEWASKIWQWLQMAWDKILEGARAAIDWLVQTFVPIWETIAGAVSKAWSVAVEAVRVAVGFLVDWFSKHFLPGVTGVWEKAKEGFGRAFGELSETVSTIFGRITAAWDAIKGPLGTVLAFLGRVIAGFFVDLVTRLVESGRTIWEWAQKIWPVVVEFISRYVEYGKVVVGVFFNAIKNWVSTAINVIKGFLPTLQAIVEGIIGVVGAIVRNVGPNILNFVKDFWNAFTQALGGIIDIISGVFSAIMALIRGDWGKAWDHLKKVFSGAWDVIKAVLGLAWENLKRFFKELPSAIFNILKTLGPHLLDIGVNLIKGLWNGIKAGWSFLWESLKNIFFGIIDAVKSWLGISSPSTVFAKIGGWLVQGFLKGVQTYWKIVVTYFKVIWTVITTIFKVAWAVISTVIKVAWAIIKPIIQGIGLFITNVLAPVFRWLVDVVKWAWDRIAVVTKLAVEGFGIIFGWIKSVIGSVVVPAFKLIWTIVSTVFRAVAAIITWAWNNIIMPIFRFIGTVITSVVIPAFKLIWGIVSTVFKAVVKIISWAWNNVVMPIFRVVATVIQSVVIPAFQIIWTIVSTVFRAVAAIITWAWDNIIQPIFTLVKWFITTFLIPGFLALWDIVRMAWGFISQAISFAWNNIIKPIWDLIWSVITNVLIPIFNTLWSVVQMVWGFISSAISFAWNVIIKPIWDAIWNVITGVLVPIFNTLWGAVQYVWARIQGAISWAWNVIIKPIWDAIWGFIANTLLPWFQSLWEKIKSVWQNISDKITNVWNWIKDHIWNPIINFIVDKFIPKFLELKDKVVAAWNKIKEKAIAIWNKVKSIVQGAVNGIIDIINVFIRAINSIADTIGIDFEISEIRHIDITGGGGDRRQGPGARGGGGSMSLMAEGGVVPHQEIGGGFVTNRPRAIVGEGSRIHPEFVVPTDPKHRSRALSLFKQLGYALMDKGGYLGLDPGFGSKVKNVVDMTRGRVYVVSGFRTRAQQERLYARYQAGRGNKAARPGTSMHEQGLAVDFGGDYRRYIGVINSQGLINTVPGEPWHFEAREGRSIASQIAGAVQTLIRPVWNLASKGINPAIDKIPWEFARKILQKLKAKVDEWVNRKADEQERELQDGRAVYDEGARAGAGGVQRWAGIAAQALAHTGSPAHWLDSLLRRMQQESGGNPNAINNWDSNARRGTPSKGLMQVIDPTFNAYAGDVRGRGIWDPFANIVASIRYANARYGKAPLGWDRRGGYARGAWEIKEDQTARIHKGEMILPSRMAGAVRNALSDSDHGHGGDTFTFQSGAIVIRVSGDDPEAARRAGRAAGKGFMEVIEERRVMTDARLTRGN